MEKRERIITVLLYSIFITYIFLLIKILFLSRVSLTELFYNERTVVRSINLVPFHSILAYISGSSYTVRRFAFVNVAGNIVIFIPLGIYLPLFKRDKRVFVNLLFILIASIIVEIIQGLFGIGVSDIDDIILNTLGGFIGVIGYKFLLSILGKEKKVCILITILSVIIGLPGVLYFLFMVKMRF